MQFVQLTPACKAYLRHNNYWLGRRCKLEVYVEFGRVLPADISAAFENSICLRVWYLVRRENKWLRSELKIMSLLRALLEDLRSSVQEPALSLRFAKEKLTKSRRLSVRRSPRQLVNASISNRLIHNCPSNQGAGGPERLPAPFRLFSSLLKLIILNNTKERTV